MIGKAQIIELVLIVVGVLVVLVMVGPTTGSSGILGNTLIAGNIRNGIAVVGSLFVVFVLFIFLEGIGSFGRSKGRRQFYQETKLPLLKVTIEIHLSRLAYWRFT